VGEQVGEKLARNIGLQQPVAVLREAVFVGIRTNSGKTSE
jgi:hypothetical protein